MSEAATMPAPGPEPEVIEADDVADLVAPLPEVNAAAIRAEEAQQPKPDGEAPQAPPQAPPAAAAAPTQRPAAAAKPRGEPALVDMHGRTFDPLLHECTPDGKPILNTYGKRAGKLKCRRTPLKEWRSESAIGDEAAAPADAAVAGDAPQAPPALDAEAIAAQRKAAAATLGGLQIALMRMALGPELATEQAEGAALVQSWEAVLAYHDVQSFNPWIGLALCTGGVVMASMHKPDTRSRLARLTEWTKVRLYALWLRVTGRKPKAHAAEKRDDAKPEAKPEPAAAAA